MLPARLFPRLSFRPVSLRAALLAFAVLTTGLSGCDRAPSAPPAPPVTFKASDLGKPDFGKQLSLTDHTGQRRTLKDFEGKVLLLFFGYTQCPDVCPTAMQRFVDMMGLLGEQGKNVQVAFVTVDPERDTQQHLAQYVPFFHPSFIGLYGNKDETLATTKEFRVFFTKREAAGPLAYTIDHWAGAYAFDKQGRLRLYIPPEQSAADVATDVRTLLSL